MSIIDEIQNKILDLNKIFNLDENSQKIVMELYKNMLKSIDQGNTRLLSTSSINSLITNYNTLLDWGFLITRREKNIDEILN